MTRFLDIEAELRRLWADGKTAKECAKALGCASNTVLIRVKTLGLMPLVNMRRCTEPGCGAALIQQVRGRLCKAHAPAKPPPVARTGKPDPASLRAMAKAGVSISDAARASGLHYQSLRKIAKREGIVFLDGRLNAGPVAAVRPPPIREGVTPLQSAILTTGHDISGRAVIAVKFGISTTQVFQEWQRLIKDWRGVEWLALPARGAHKGRAGKVGKTSSRP